MQERGIYAASTWITVRCAVTAGLIAIDCAGDGHDRFVAGDSVSIVLNPAKTLVLQP